MYIQTGARDPQRRKVKRPGQRRPRRKQQESGIEKQPSRAEQQQEPQVPPAVTPAAQMRRPPGTVGIQGGRHLGNAPSGERSFHDHFGSELHTGGAQSERENSLPVEATQAAMEVGYGGAEE